MKINFKHSLLLLIALAISVVLSRCSKNDEMGTPSISYIRVTDPTKSDSLLTIAGQGKMVVIIGQNLGSVQSVWFNDQPGQLVPTFITNTSVFTVVPTQIPSIITDKMKMVFKNGSSIEYDFSVDISKPLVDHVRSEYVNDGDSLYIYGDYFYAPLTVTFAGGKQGTILSIGSDYKSLVVKVPTGVQPGPITVASNFGVRASVFWFRDNRNMIASFDIPLVNNIWHADAVVASDPNVPNLNNKFLRVNKGAKGAYPYIESYEGTQGSDLSVETRNIPQDAFTNPAAYSLKFEINTLQSLTGANLRIYLGNDNGCCGGDFGGARNATYYVWQPNLHTYGGTWQTVSISWSDIYTANNQFAYNSAGYGMAMYWHGPNPATYNLAIDNIRVVPNKYLIARYDKI